MEFRFIIYWFVDEIEKSFYKGLMSKSELFIIKIDINIVFVEYLLGKFVFGGFYIIDVNIKNKDICRCGCGVYLVFESIGIGKYL